MKLREPMPTNKNYEPALATIKNHLPPSQTNEFIATNFITV
jgi:hypothetical protein